MLIAAFVLAAAVSLAASVFLVSHLERVGERLGLSEALLGLLAARVLRAACRIRPCAGQSSGCVGGCVTNAGL